MKIKALLPFTIIFVLLFSSFDSDAQYRNKYKKRKSRSKSISKYRGGSVGGRFRPYTFVGFNVNALNYYGDLAPVNRAASTDVSFTRPGFGLDLGYKLSSYVGVRASFNWGRIKGDDITSLESKETTEKWEARYARGLSFRNDIKELSLGFEIQFIPNYGGPAMRPPLNPYLFIGATVFHHEPKALVPEFDYQTGGTVAAPQAGEWVKLRTLGTEGQNLDNPQGEAYLPISFAIPIALGVRMRLPGPFEAAVELGFRYVFTDYLDDVSTNYVGLDRFDDDLARIMSDRSAEPVSPWTDEVRNLEIGNVQNTSFEGGERYFRSVDNGSGIENSIRGNPDNNDMYFVTSLKLRYIISKTRSSAKFR